MFSVTVLWTLLCLLLVQQLHASPIAEATHVSHPRITLVNNLGNDTTVIITCTDRARNVSVFVGQDGRFQDFDDHYDVQGSSDGDNSDGQQERQPLPPQRVAPEVISIPLGAAGGNFSFQLPTFVSSCRAYYAKGDLWIGVVPDADGHIGVVEPAFNTPGDSNYDKSWAFAEFARVENETFNVNPSSVDFVDISVALDLTRIDSDVTVGIDGLFPDAKHNMCDELKNASTSDAPWSKGCRYDDHGNLTRVVAPIHIDENGAFEAYWGPHIDQVLDRYTAEPFIVETHLGERQCWTDLKKETLSCDGMDPIFFRPSPKDIFGCNSGPFARPGADGLEKKVMTSICAALNRGTMIDSTDTTMRLPSQKAKAYKSSVHNVYSKAVHDNEHDGLGYGFAYDDVDENGQGVAGILSMPWDQADELTIFVGGRLSHQDQHATTTDDSTGP